jgi:large subunit ribosomal protein L5
MSRLLEKYKSEVIAAMTKKFNYKNVMQVPKLDKIVINMAVGDAVGNAKILDSAIADLTAIAGQKPVITRAHKSLAAWKLRKGMPIGCKVTLRGQRMFDFLDKFMNIALPRVRDFRGVNRNSFDGRGNYSIGVKEQLIFPEIDYDKIDKIRGMDIIVVTTANSDEEAREFLALMGMPFANA